MKKQLIAMLMIAVLVMSGLGAMPAMPAKAAEDTGEETTIVERVMAQLASREENNVLNGAMPCRGEAHALVINVVVEGEEKILPTQTLRDMMYGEYTSPNFHHPNQNLADYFELASYGKLHVSGDVVEYRCDEFVEENVGFLKQAMNAVMAERDPQDYDRNGDGYFDAVYFVVPSGRNTGTTGFWNYEYNGMKSANYARITQPGLVSAKNIQTICHETIHLMGLPDIYANVSLNPEGTQADTVMDGSPASGGSDTGWRTANVPGIMKLLYGWFDNVIEVSSSDSYELRSYSGYPEVMILYPNGDTNSKFIFLVELVSYSGSDAGMVQVSGNRGGLRIWRVLLNVDDDGAITGNSTQTGTGNSPYSYLEALSKYENSKFFVRTGGEIDASTNPSLDYCVEFFRGPYYSSRLNYTYDRACYPKKYLDSGLAIRDVAIDGDEGSFRVTYDEMEDGIVRFVANGGYGYMGNLAGEIGGTVDLPECGFTAPSGRRFKGWKVGKTLYAPGDSITVDGDLYATAVWEWISTEGFTVSYEWEEIDDEAGDEADHVKYKVTARAVHESNSSWKEEETVAADYTLVTAPTCEEDGEEKWVAAFDSNLFEEQTKVSVLTAKGHVWNEEYTVDQEPTTSAEGSESIHCAVCGAIQEGSERPIAKVLGASAQVWLTNVASGIKVSWKAVAGAKYYRVYRGDTYLFTTSQLYGVDKDVAVKMNNGGKYTYKVVASYSKALGVGDSPYSRTSTGYRLIPVGIKSLKNPAAGKMTVTYDKNAKGTGYVVQYWSKSDMSDAKVIAVKGANTVSRTFSGMQKGKTYNVQVRVYKLVGDKRYYSGYCTTKKIKIEK